MLPSQSTRPDRRPGAHREAAAGPRHCRACGARHARPISGADHVRPIALRNHYLRSTGHPGGTRPDVVIVRSLPILFLTVVSLFGESPPNWDRWQFLMGEWVGEGGGEPGQGTGSFSF